jgi:hypothetical protein
MPSESSLFDPRICNSVSVGDVAMTVAGCSPEDVSLGAGLEQFRKQGSAPGITVSVEWTPMLRSFEGFPAFDSGGVWTLFRDGCDFVLDFCSPIVGNHPYKRLRVDHTFRNAQLTLNLEALQPYWPVFPLEYPADELLITNYLATHGLGVEVHGCGIIDDESGGHLLLGHSGAGKSTTARLWKSLRNSEILSDDRIILRFERGELWMYGTPWHGEAAFASPGRCRVREIFVLQHGDRNKMVPMAGSQAVGELFARCFPPFHSAAGLQHTIAFLDLVAKVVPCYRFYFLPNVSAVEAVIAHATAVC